MCMDLKRQEGTPNVANERNYESYPFQFEGILLNLNLNPLLMAIKELLIEQQQQ